MRAARINDSGRAAQSGERCRTVARRLLLVAATALVAAAASPVSVALAAPEPAITSPSGVINDSTPSFSGTTNEPGDELTVNIYREGAFVRTLGAMSPGFTWTAGPTEALVNGTYTAFAEQTNLFNERGASVPVTFTVSVPPPNVTMTSPANHSSTTSGSQPVAGSADTASGDPQTVIVRLFAGEATAAQASLQAIVVQATNGVWSTTFGGLGPGVYTTQAEQLDAAGNRGLSMPVTFTVTAPIPPPPPVASFKWFPATPQTGENVALVSSSVDPASPIVAFAWSLSASGPFSAGTPVFTTSFSTPGSHSVRLRVTDAGGRSGEVTETIPVAARPLPLMLPVPIVRIAGYETSSGVNISSLTVQAPVSARVTVTCRGRGCPRRFESFLARASKNSRATSVQIAFRRFERSLRAGVVLEIRVFKPGEIGKFTRFVIRRHALPVRVDSCLGAIDPSPIACPS
jgi:hypothetical protein